MSLATIKTAERRRNTGRRVHAETLKSPQGIFVISGDRRTLKKIDLTSLKALWVFVPADISCND